MKNRAAVPGLGGIVLAVAVGCVTVKETTLPGMKAEIEIRNLSNKTFVEHRRMGIGDVFQLGDTDYNVEMKAFYPDFYFDRKTKRAETRGERIRNPAAELEVYLGEKAAGKVWVFPHYLAHGKRPGEFVFRILSITGADGKKIWGGKKSQGKSP